MARRPPNTELDALIEQYQHLSDLPRGDHALHTLRKIGSIVKPIMRQRSWHVGTLAEFYPEQSNLLGLNINGGQKINLRLRYPGDSNQFLPLDEVVDTMLHELCHNVIGPHNQAFHALWDQLRDEHQSLVMKGYTGEGFLGRGQSVGGRRMPLHEASRLARQAAELRRQAAERAKGSGQRLGGSGIMRGQDARQIIADAVERRVKIERGCASGTAAGDRVVSDEAERGEKVTTTQAGPDDENESTMMQAYIDLIQEEEREKFGGYYSPPSAEYPAGSRGTLPKDKTKSLVEQQREIEQNILKQKSGSPSSTSTTLQQDTPSIPQQKKPKLQTQPPMLKTPLIPQTTKQKTQQQPQPPAASEPPPPPSSTATDKITTWTCEICTLINPLTYLTCDACGVERPSWIAAVLDSQPPPPPPPRNSASSTSTTSRSNTPTHPALKLRSTAYDSISRFNAESAQKVNKGPVGWTCGGCGNFMEAEWWTCARCGRMKDSS